jgi:hypothetical protein
VFAHSKQKAIIKEGGGSDDQQKLPPLVTVLNVDGVAPSEEEWAVQFRRLDNRQSLASGVEMEDKEGMIMGGLDTRFLCVWEREGGEKGSRSSSSIMKEPLCVVVRFLWISFHSLVPTPFFVCQLQEWSCCEWSLSLSPSQPS